MSTNPKDRFAGTPWFARLRVTATGDVTLKTVPAATAAAAATATLNRLVVEWYKITGLNTNAGVTAIEIRNATTTTAVLLGYTMAATTGSVNDANSDIWMPLIAGESLQLSVATAITGHIDITIGGRIISTQNQPLADKYTAVP